MSRAQNNNNNNNHFASDSLLNNTSGSEMEGGMGAQELGGTTGIDNFFNSESDQ